MYSIVKDNRIIKNFVKLPKTIYDKELDRHIELIGKEIKQSYGYYWIEKDPLPDATKTYGEPIYDSVNDRVYYEIIDKVYNDYYDYTQDPPVLIKTALDVLKEKKHVEVENVQAELRNIVVDWIIKKFVLGESISNEQKTIFQQFYTQIDTWKSEIDQETDVKLLDKKEFDSTTIENLKKDLKDVKDNKK